MSFWGRLRPRPLAPASAEMLNLDVLRFIASCGIIFHHSHEFLVPAAQRAAVMPRSHGLAMFVDMFFLISGYVISRVYSERIWSLRDYGIFLQRRVGRLAPLHLLTLALTMGLFAALLVLKLPAKHVPSFSLACIAETALLLHGFVPCGNGQFFNGVSWSISVEMLMYLAFPLWLVISRRGWPRVIGLVAAAALAAATWPYWAFMSAQDWTERVSPVLRVAVGFGGGVALYRSRGALARVNVPEVVMWGAVLAFVGAAWFGALALVDLVLCAVVVASAVSLDNRRTAGRLTAALAPQGQLTYSMYMWHSTIVLVMVNLLGDKLLHLSGGAAGALLAVTYAVIWAVSRLSFEWFETPMRKAVDALPIFEERRSVRAARSQAA